MTSGATTPIYVIIAILILIQLLSMALMKMLIYGQDSNPKAPKTPIWLNILAIVGGVVTLLLCVVGLFVMAIASVIWKELLWPLIRLMMRRPRQTDDEQKTAGVHGAEM
jgi:hypothetical protein